MEYLEKTVEGLVGTLEDVLKNGVDMDAWSLAYLSSIHDRLSNLQGKSIGESIRILFDIHSINIGEMNPRDTVDFTGDPLTINLTYLEDLVKGLASHREDGLSDEEIDRLLSTKSPLMGKYKKGPMDGRYCIREWSDDDSRRYLNESGTYTDSISTDEQMSNTVKSIDMTISTLLTILPIRFRYEESGVPVSIHVSYNLRNLIKMLTTYTGAMVELVEKSVK